MLKRSSLLLLVPLGLLAQEDAIREFRIEVDDRVLADLRDRLDNTRFPDQIPDSGWDYGADTAYLRALVDYWRGEYDWRRHEAAINELPHFKTQIDGLELHFVHVRSKEPDALPSQPS